MCSFALVGVVSAAIFSVVIHATVFRLGLPVFVASVVAFASAMPISYLGNRFFTFRSHNLVPVEATRFFAVQLVNIFTTSGIVDVVVSQLQAPLYVGALTAFVFAPVFSFIFYERWVYRQI